MTVHSLLHHILKLPTTRVSVSLRQLAADMQERSGKKAELLCDFTTVVQWLLSGHDHQQIKNGMLSPYSTLYGGDFNSYSSCVREFVEALQLVGIQPVFFLGVPPGSGREEFELNIDQYKEAALRVQQKCAIVEQVCAGNKDVLQVRWSLSEATVIQVQFVLRAMGVGVVGCQGQPWEEMVQYLRLHHQVVGVVSNDAELALFVPDLNLFMPYYLMSVHLNDATPLSVLTRGECDAVSSASLAGALGLKENQLPYLAAIFGCDDDLLVELGLEERNLEAMIKWVQDRKEPIAKTHPRYEALMLQIQNRYQLMSNEENCRHVSDPKLVRIDSYDDSKLETGESEVACDYAESIAKVVNSRVQTGAMMPQLLSMVEGRYWRSSAVELASLGQPCINDLTLPLRLSLYSLMGLKRVTEYGRTEMKSFDTISVELKARVDCGVRQLKSLEERSRNERLCLLFHLVGLHKHYHDCGELQESVSAALQVGAGIAESISGTAVVACASLILLFRSNEVVSSFPQIKYFEFDALLITCLCCAAGYPPTVLMRRPPTRAVSIGMYFSHILEQAYIVASYFGLLDDLPAPADLFYSMAYVPYHVAGFSELATVTPSHVDDPGLVKTQDRLCSLHNLEPVLALRAEIIDGSKDPNISCLLELFASSVTAVTAYKAQVREKEIEVSSLPLEGGFSLCVDRSEDLELSSSVNSDGSSFLKCSELPTAQDYQASEENLYFTRIFDDDIDSDVDDVMAKNIDSDIIDLEGGKEDEVTSVDTADGDGRALPNCETDFKLSDSPDQTKQQLDVAGPPFTESVAEGYASESIPPTTKKPVGNAGPVTSLHPSSVLPHSTALDKIPPPVQSSAARPPPPLPPRSRPPSQKRVCPFPAHVEERELPVMSHREKILELIRSHQVICIEGETGCGKSTKIPQFILDDSLKSNPAVPCRILVTQPRRVAVIKLAERVAAERKERIGRTVGYCIGGERHRNSETSLTYCTVGYMLHALIHDPSMILRYTHIILDEIHERSTDADFALIIVRKLVATSTNLKVIIMSATMEGHVIANYFEEMVNFSDVADPYFVGAKRYHVEQYFIDELDRLADSKKSVWSEWQTNASLNLKQLILKQPPENLQQALTMKPSVTEYAQQVCTEVIISQANLGEQILVFLPGIAEIATYYDMLTSVLETRDLTDHFLVFVMHSQVPFEDQKELFKPPIPCKTHVILATNIAESSITLPRLRLVINFGIYRQLEYNSKRHMSQLTKKWCSHASCAQRAGRAGRVFEGVAVHLFTKRFFWVIAPEFDPPEILHAPLAKLVLQAKQIGSKMGVSSPSEFLSQAMDPPSLEQMELALKELASFGAIVSHPDSPVSEDAEITLLGRFALSLPLDIEFSRLVLYGIFFGIPTDAIIIAAVASLSQDVFSLPTRIVIKEEEVYGNSLRRSMKSRYYHDAGQYSDAIMVCNMFREWIEYKNRIAINEDTQVKHISFLRCFCNVNSVRWQRLLQLEHSIADIASRILPLVPKEYRLHEDIRVLCNITSYRRGFSFMSDVEVDGDGRKQQRLRLCTVSLHFCEDVNTIKALMAAAFCHNFMIGHRGSESTVSKDKTNAYQALSYMSHLGYNPADTVMFRGDQTASRVDVDDLVSTVLPRRFCDAKLVDGFWYVHLHPQFRDNPKTKLMRAQEAAQDEFQLTLGQDLQNSNSVVSLNLSPDICYFWQYGERKHTWKVADAVFSKPQHPLIVDWIRVSKDKERVMVNSWRNPSGLVCEVGPVCAPFFGVVSTMQAFQHRNAVSGYGVTVLPSLSNGKEALLMLLAFQSQNVKISFLMNRGKLTGLKIDTFYLPLSLEQVRRISADDIVRINELRQAMSQVIRTNGEVSHCLPIEGISIIHGLLKCVLKGVPSDLICPTDEPRLYATIQEVPQPQQLDEDDDSEFEFEPVAATVDEGVAVIPQTPFQFYPPIECPLLDAVMIRPIPMEYLEIDYLFQKKSSAGVYERLGASSSLLPPPSELQEQVEGNHADELKELEEHEGKDQQGQEGASEQLSKETAPFRLSALAEPFVPSASNINLNPRSTCPSPVVSPGHQCQSLPVLNGQEYSAPRQNSRDFSLLTKQESSVQGAQDLVKNMQNPSVQNVQDLRVDGCDFREQKQQQQQMRCGPQPSLVEQDALPLNYAAGESTTHRLLPLYSPVNPYYNPQTASHAYSSLLKLIENISNDSRRMQQARTLCQFLFSAAHHNQQWVRPFPQRHLSTYPPAHLGFRTEYAPHPMPTELERDVGGGAISHTVHSSRTSRASESSDIDKSSDLNGQREVEGDAGVHLKEELESSEPVSSCRESQPVGSLEQKASENLVQSVPPTRVPQSPTTGLEVERKEDELSSVVENFQLIASATCSASKEPDVQCEADLLQAVEVDESLKGPTVGSSQPTASDGTNTEPDAQAECDIDLTVECQMGETNPAVEASQLLEPASDGTSTEPNAQTECDIDLTVECQMGETNPAVEVSQLLEPASDGTSTEPDAQAECDIDLTVECQMGEANPAVEVCQLLEPASDGTSTEPDAQAECDIDLTVECQMGETNPAVEVSQLLELASDGTSTEPIAQTEYDIDLTVECQMGETNPAVEVSQLLEPASDGTSTEPIAQTECDIDLTVECQMGETNPAVEVSQLLEPASDGTSTELIAQTECDIDLTVECQMGETNTAVEVSQLLEPASDGTSTELIAQTECDIDLTVECQMGETNTAVEVSQLLEPASDGTSTEPNAQADDHDSCPVKVTEECVENSKSLAVEKSQAVAADGKEHNTDKMLDEKMFDIHPCEVEGVVTGESSSKQIQSKVEHDPSSATAQENLPTFASRVPPSISGQPASCPVATSHPVSSPKGMAEPFDWPERQRCVTSRKRCLSDPTAVRNEDVQRSAYYNSRVSQALLSPPRQLPLLPLPVPLPVPLSPLVSPQHSRTSTTLPVHPDGHSTFGPRVPPGFGHLHRSAPTLPVCYVETPQIGPAHSFPSLFNGYSRYSMGIGAQLGRRPTPESLPNQERSVPHNPPNRPPFTFTGVTSSLLQPPPGFEMAQSSSRDQKSESVPMPTPTVASAAAVYQGQPPCHNLMPPQFVSATGVAAVSQLASSNAPPEVALIGNEFVTRPSPHTIVPLARSGSQRGRETSRPSKKHPHRRHHEPLMRYQGPPQPLCSNAPLQPPPGLGFPLPPPPPPPSSHRRGWSKPPRPPPPQPSLLTTYTARHEIPPLMPAILPNPSSHVHKHQASGLNVLPLKYNRHTKHKREERIPSYGQYGIPEDVLINCYCTVLATKGEDMELNMLCGPYYRDILKCFSICARENELLAPNFFSKHSCFSVYGEPGHFMVKLNSVAGDRSRMGHADSGVPHHKVDSGVDDNSKPAGVFSSRETEQDKAVCQKKHPVAATANANSQSRTLLETTDTSLNRPETTNASLMQPETMDSSRVLTGPSHAQSKASSVTLTQPETANAPPMLHAATSAHSETTDVSRITTDPSLTQLDQTIDTSLTQPDVSLTQQKNSNTQLEVTDASLITVDVSLTRPESPDASLTEPKKLLGITNVRLEGIDANLESIDTKPLLDNLLPRTTDPSITQPKSTGASPAEATNKQPETAEAQAKLESRIIDEQAETTEPQSKVTEVQTETVGTVDTRLVTTDVHHVTSTAQSKPPEAVDERVKGTDAQCKVTCTHPETSDGHDSTAIAWSENTGEQIIGGTKGSLAELVDASQSHETTDLSLNDAQHEATELSLVKADKESVQCEMTSGQMDDNVEMEENQTIPLEVPDDVPEAAFFPTTNAGVEKETWGDEEEKEMREPLVPFTDASVQDAPTIPVYGTGEEITVERDLSPVVATADSANSEVTLSAGEPATEDWDDNVMLSSATVGDSTSRENRPSSATGFDEDCWVESGLLASHASSDSDLAGSTCTQHRPQPWMETAVSVYDEDCWVESASPVKKMDSVPFRPKREGSKDEPFSAQKSDSKHAFNEPHSREATDSDSGGRMARGDWSSTKKLWNRRTSQKRKKKQRDKDSQGEGRERYSPVPQSSSTSWGRMSERPSFQRMTGDGSQRPERPHRYLDEVKQRFRREGSRDRDRPRSGEVASSDSSSSRGRDGQTSDGGKRQTWEYRRGRQFYSGPQRKPYGTGWSWNQQQQMDESGRK